MRGLADYRARLAVVALVLLAVWEVAALVDARESAPTTEDWSAAAAAIRTAAAPDALIVFAPPWIDPVGRLWFGDRISPAQAARMDSARYREVFEVSIRGASAVDVADETARSEQSFGKVRVRKFVRQHAPTIDWELTEGTSIHEVDFEPRRGVVLELRGAYEQRQLQFPHVSFGTELHVAAGVADYKARAENRATALLVVRVDGEVVTQAVVGNDSGWLALPVATTRPGRHDVEFFARVQNARAPIHLALAIAAESRTPTP